MATILESARARLGMSQEDLADRVGVSRGFISMIERGMKTTSTAIFSRICDALKLTPEERLDALAQVASVEGQPRIETVVDTEVQASVVAA